MFQWWKKSQKLCLKLERKEKQKQLKWKSTALERQCFLEQQLSLWLPNAEQHVHCSAGLQPAHGDEAGEEEEKEWLQLLGNEQLLDVQENS